MEIPFIGGAYTGRSSNLNAQVCQNWFPIIDQQDGKSILSMMGTPGLVEWTDTGASAEARGSIKWEGLLYAVFGATLYKFDTSGTATNVGTLLTSTGRVFMAGGVTHLCITDGTYGYYQIAGAAALTQIVDVDFPTPTSLCYLDGFFIVTREDTDEIYISSSEDASAWDGLDFASAEDSPDDVEIAHTYKRHLIAFGTDSIELFYNTGDASYPFTRVAGAVLEIGVGAANSVASGPEGLFFLDNNLQIRLFVGYETQIISTEQIDYQIRGYTTKSDAWGYTYTQEGHSFYILSFPTEGKTWAYDVVTKFWHTRSSGLASGRHKTNWHQWFAGKNLVGDYANGKIYEYSLSTYTDDGETIKSIRAAQVVQSGVADVIHHRLTLDFEAGTGLSTGLATGTAVLTAGVVTSVTIDDGGSGYATTPKITFTGGEGSGAVATTTLTAGVVTGVTIIAGGSGYTSPPTATFVGGTQDPQAMLDWSDDGGHTWSNEHWRGIGAIGDYKNRVVWRRLGMSRNRIYRLTITDAVKRVLMGAHLEAEVTNG